MEETLTLPDSTGTKTTQPSFESIAELIKTLSEVPIAEDCEIEGSYFKSERYRKNLENKAAFYNSQPGILIGYNCTVCNNKGHVMYITDDFREVCKECECGSIRECIRSMNASGIDSEVLNSCTFETFKDEEEWQKKMKLISKRYTEAIKAGDTKHWLLMSGQSGSGKTHLSTAVCIELMKAGLKVKYMTWNDIVHKAQQAKYSADAYNDFIKSINEADVFYIDDLFKTEKSERDIAFEIINMRYISAKPTIISTEVNLEGIQAIDGAIAGRINDMSRGYMCQIKNDEARNYRRRK
jgi:DNA replication protein DnaC